MEEIEKIIRAMEHLDNETLKKTLAYLLQVYVIDKKVLYDNSVKETAPVLQENTSPLTFTELFTELKRKYKMEELKRFSIEGGKVFIQLDNKRYQLSADAAAEQQSGSFSRPQKQENANMTNRFKNIEMDE